MSLIFMTFPIEHGFMALGAVTHQAQWWAFAVVVAAVAGVFFTVRGWRAVRRSFFQKKQPDESRTLAAHAARMAKFGYWTIDLGSNEVRLTAEAAVLCGWPAEPCTLYGEWARALAHPEDWPRLKEAVTVCAREGKGFELEARIIRMDGVTRHVRLLGERHGEGRRKLCVGCMQDITALVMAKDALRASAGRYHDILESINEGYFEVDQRGRFTFSNRALQRMLGYAGAELLLLDYRRLLSGEDAAAVRRVFEEAERSLTPGIYSGRVCQRDGKELFVEASVLPLTDGSDQAAGFRVVVRDVTWRVLEEERRRVLERQVWNARKMESLSVLAGGVAHEFNNLLTGVLGYSELAELSPGCGPEVRDCLGHIKDATERAGRLARQMLAYSGRGRFAVHRVRLDEFAEEMAGPLSTQAAKGMRLRLERAEETQPVEADRAQLHQLLLNLVLNASEAAGEGGGEIVVRTGMLERPAGVLEEPPLRSAMKAGRHAYLEVSDSGPGMDAATLDQIFDPFFSTKFVGRGLGLSAVLGIVRGHHGGVWVESAPGRGAKVRVCFPVCAAGGGDAEDAPWEAAGHPSWTGSGLILLAEDEGEVRRLGVEMLGMLGFEVDAVDDGRAAVERFMENPESYRCVVLDWMMPRMNGDDAVAAMRARRDGLPAVVTSGYTEEEALRRIAGIGNVVFVQKPYSMATLAAAVRRAIGE